MAALVAALPAELLRARLAGETLRSPRRLVARYELDLPGLLNAASADELRAWCAALGLTAGTPGAMRQRLWAWGAAHERRGLVDVAPAATAQPVATLARGRLVVASPRQSAADPGVLPSARAARAAASPSWPRPVPPARAAPPAAGEPDTLDELLTRADALVGVRLGTRGRDKGAYGSQLEQLLGLRRSSASAPDWRGEVECKSLAVVRAAGATWRIKDGPALSMRGVDATAKCRRLLWIVRVDEGEVPGSPVLSWFYQELDDALCAALERASHLRPKGGAGTAGRGWYLRREYFVACGLLASLNGR